MRAALALTDIAPYVASLTTINTPHRGCQFADYLLGKIPQKQQQMVANTYNAGAAKLGDINPDFLAAVYDLTSEKCSEFNNEIKDNPDIYYQSVGSKLNHPASGRFPLNFTYPLVKYFDGPNDGLVGEESFRWGQNYQFLTVSGKTDSHQVIFYLKFMVVLEQVLQPMALISLFRLHTSLVDVFWTILIKD